MADAADFDRQMAAQNARGEEILWHEVPNENILVEGLGFFAEERRWNRLPQSLSGMLQAQRPALIELSSHMAGACLRFRTDSRAVWVKAAVNAAPYMAHMTPAAQCGCDCYLRALPDMAWQFAGLTKFSPQEDSFCCELARDLPPHTEVLVYLPLYIGIRSIAIGLEKGAQMQPALPRKHRRTIAFYGTSITQGGCASRPGMAYPAILSRELDREVYNLGFSGNGVGMSGLASCFCSLPRLGALVVALVIGERFFQLSYILLALVLGFVAYGLSIYFYVYAQRKLGAAKTSAYYAISPFIGVLLSLLIFQEMPSLSFWTALLIMALGAYFAA